MQVWRTHAFRVQAEEEKELREKAERKGAHKVECPESPGKRVSKEGSSHGV